MIKKYILVATTLFVSCAPLKTNKVQNHRLNFEKSIPENRNYDTICIRLKKGAKKSRLEDNGCYEYQFLYSDSSIFYVSSNIYSGSRLNFQNLLTIGVDTYGINRSNNPLDTIKNAGIQSDGNFWLEYILGDVVVGYVNANHQKQQIFNKSIESLEREKD